MAIFEDIAKDITDPPTSIFSLFDLYNTEECGRLSNS